jgi:mono/diheme cytochrome c family protein
VGTAASQNTWKAPASSNQLRNPLAGNSTATDKGKKLYKKMCAICHGDKGKGDGMAGMALKPRPADFSLGIIQTQSDGALYWKLTEGKAPMAAYKTILSDEQRWQLVNYIRTLK